MIDLNQEEKEVARLSALLGHLEASLKDESKARMEAEKHLFRVEIAQSLLQLVAQAVQQKAHEKIAGVVSSCLSAVFEDPYKFQIDFERKRGRTEAVLQFRRGDLLVDPLTASGGGAIDVAAFALRAACLMLHRPRLSKLLVLDEPFRFVSAEYQENIRSMLEGLSKDLGLQIIMVTHNETIATGKIIRL